MPNPATKKWPAQRLTEFREETQLVYKYVLKPKCDRYVLKLGSFSEWYYLLRSIGSLS